LSSTTTEPAFPTHKSIYELSLTDFINSSTVSSVLSWPKNLLVVHAGDSVTDLLQRLKDNALRCAIVYDNERLYVGFVDALDIATHVLNVTHWSKQITADTFRNLDWKGQRFASQPSGELMNISLSDPFETLTPNAPLRQAVKLMADGIHRIAIVENGSIVNVLSQWDFLLFAASRLSFVGNQFQRTVGEIGLGTQSSNLLVVKQWTDVIGVISFMYDNGLSGVPLVDEHARIVQNFSATDLLNLTRENFPLLSLPARDFLLRIHGYLKPPVCCRKTDSIENVLLKFLYFGVHRVYVVDDNYHPIGVITLTDIMQSLLISDRGSKGQTTTSQ